MPYKVTQRQTIVFIAGLALGIGAAWAIFGRSADEPKGAAARPAAAAAAKATPTAVTVAIGACDFKPVVTTAASDDGRVQLVSDLAGRGAKDVDAWILDGKEAVAAGRQKDAESDFLMACRAAEKLGDAGAMPQAEAMYHLGRHYAGLAGAAAPGRGSELWSRAEQLFAASLQAYQGRYGESSDKTRFAAKGLAEAREHTGGTPAVATAAPARAAEAKVAKVEAPKAEAPKVEAPKVEAPKVEAAKVAAPKVEAPKVEAPKAPAPLAAPKEPVVASRPPAPKAAEPAVIAAPKAPAPAPQPAVAVAPPKAPEPPKVAVARPAPPKPRPAPEPMQEAEERVVVEPPAAAVGSATSAAGQAQGEATGSPQ